MVPHMKAGFPWKMHGGYGQEIDAVPLGERTVGEVRPMLLLLLGAVAAVLLVVCVNVANLMHAVTRRRHEIGVRIALGAQPGDVLRLVLAQGIAIAVGGTIVGLAGAGLLARTLRALLVEVTPVEPSIYTASALSLIAVIAVAMFAAWLPARRATRVDPALALRTA